MSKKQHRPYRRPAGPPPAERRRKEWVELTDGDLCCWSLLAGELMQMRENAERPGIDPRGGLSTMAASAWLIALSARDGDGLDARRVWDDLTWTEIYQMDGEDYIRLLRAAERVNGMARAEVQATEDFTGATGAHNSSESSSSVSKNSTGSPVKSPSLITS